MFGSGGTCSSCGQNIPATELVMRVQGNVYHIKCFTCVTCHHQLNPGERFSLVNGSLLCEQDYPKVLRGHTQVPARSSHKMLRKNTPDTLSYENDFRTMELWGP